MSDGVQVAVIGDLVRSTSRPDRAALQDALVAALEVANAAVEAVQPLEPTIGDEVQAVYADVRAALVATTVVNVALDPPAACRFGIGVGEVRVIGRTAHGLTQDGSAWWAARDAVDAAKAGERRHGAARSRLLLSDDVETPDVAALTEGFLALRDHVVGGLSDRQRRMLRGRLLGRTQSEVAADEGVTQSTVSSALLRSGGAALLEALDLITGPGETAR